MDPTNFEIIVEQVKFKLSEFLGENNNISDSSLNKNLDEILFLTTKLFPLAESFCFNNQPANGVYSFLKITLKFLEIIRDQGFSEERHNDYLLMSQTILYCLRAVLRMSNYTKSLQSSYKDMASFPQATQLESLQETIAMATEYSKDCFTNPSVQEGYKVMLSRYIGFWYHSDYQGDAKAYSSALAFLGTSPLQIWKLFIDDAFRSDVIHKCILNSNSRFPVRLMQMITVDAKYLHSYLYFNSKVSRKTVCVDSKNPFTVNTKTFELEKSLHRDPKPIRCRYIQPLTLSTDQQTLILHCHAGGFVFGSPDMDEKYILSDVCTELGGCPILSINYALMAPFPASLQDIIDVYVWLVNEDSYEVTTALGFAPKKVILFGESAGSHMLLGLLMVLKDIESKFNHNLRRPAALVSVSGFLNASFGILPSRLLTNIDYAIPLSIAYFVQVVLSGIREDTTGAENETNLFQKATENIKRFFSNGTEKPWYLQSSEVLESVHKQSSKILSTRYASPMFAEDIRELRMPIFLMSSEFCLNLDDAVTLASIWTGPVKLDVIPDVPHAFLHLRIAKGSQEAFKLLLKRLQEAIDGVV